MIMPELKPGTPRLSRRALLQGSAAYISLGAMMSLVAACSAPPAASPTAPKVVEPTSAPAAQPAQSAPAAKAPTAETKVDTAAAEWEQVIAAAKKEGKIALVATAGADRQKSMTEGFLKKYPEIQIDYLGLAGSEYLPKLEAEFAAGQFLTDVVAAGSSTYQAMRESNMVGLIPPYLVGPESRSQSNWIEGKFTYTDPNAPYFLLTTFYVFPEWAYNTTSTAAAAIKSQKDLLDPQWKGKMAMRDPRLTGGGNIAFTSWYTTPGLGKDFITALFKQDLTISANDQQLLDWVARNQYPIGIGPSATLALETQRKGLPIEMVDTSALREGGAITTSGGFTIMKNAPHPNAIKVYLDYMLSKEGQAIWSSALKVPSLRKDVPADDVPAILIPKEGVTYQRTFDDKYDALRPEIAEFMKVVLG